MYLVLYVELFLLDVLGLFMSTFLFFSFGLSIIKRVSSKCVCFFLFFFSVGHRCVKSIHIYIFILFALS